MSHKIDFANLTLKDALDLAILVEEEAGERYAEFADQMVLHHTQEAAGFFRAMIGNEARHEAELSARRRELFPTAPRTVDRSMLWDVEAPDYDKTRAFMSARQAMEVALSSEIKAHDYFAAAVPHIKDPKVRGLFEELKNEEMLHQALVRKELEKLPPETHFNPEDFVDEPTAQ